MSDDKIVISEVSQQVICDSVDNPKRTKPTIKEVERWTLTREMTKEEEEKWNKELEELSKWMADNQDNQRLLEERIEGLKNEKVKCDVKIYLLEDMLEESK